MYMHFYSAYLSTFFHVYISILIAYKFIFKLYVVISIFKYLSMAS